METTVRTPQFSGGFAFEYVTQHGYIDTWTWIFTPSYRIGGTVGMHKVFFRSYKEYLKYRVD